MFSLKKEHGSWYYKKQNKVIYMADELAFAFSNDLEGSVLHKHGPFDYVEKWTKEAKEKWKGAGPLGEQMAKELTLVSSSEWDEKIVNRFIDTTGYIGKWYNENFN